MAVLKVISGVIAALLILNLVFFAYLGGFKQVEVERGAYGPAEIVYTTHRGSYQTIGKSWEKFQAEWEAKGLDRCDSLAVYLDPPDAPKESLRSVLGCRIDGPAEAEQAKWRAAFPGVMLPRSDALISPFPYKNYASFILAPMKVYPVMQKRMIADGHHGAVAIEEYGVIGESKQIRIIMPVGVDRSEYQPLMDAF